MIRAEFNRDGFVTSRGEHVSGYQYGDTVTVLQDINDRLVRVIVNEGESKGLIVTVNKEEITIY